MYKYMSMYKFIENLFLFAYKFKQHFFKIFFVAKWFVNYYYLNVHLLLSIVKYVSYRIEKI